MSVEGFGNPDQALIHRFLQQGGGAMPINSNPMAKALQSTLLKVDRERGEVEIGFEPGDLFIQGTGVIQGGAVTAMLDFAMAFATLAALPGEASCATVNLNTSFLRAAPQGRYMALGLVERQAKTLAFARAVTRIGEPGAGQLAKMVNQVAIAGLLQGLAEALAFGQRAGLDMKLVLDVIGKGAAQSWQMDNRGKTMVEGKFDFGFAVDWMRKDLSLVLEEARRNGSQLPVTALVDQFYAEVQGMGGQRWDTSSLIKRL